MAPPWPRSPQILKRSSNTEFPFLLGDEDCKRKEGANPTRTQDWKVGGYHIKDLEKFQLEDLILLSCKEESSSRPLPAQMDRFINTFTHNGSFDHNPTRRKPGCKVSNDNYSSFSEEYFNALADVLWRGAFTKAKKDGFFKIRFLESTHKHWSYYTHVKKYEGWTDDNRETAKSAKDLRITVTILEKLEYNGKSRKEQCVYYWALLVHELQHAYLSLYTCICTKCANDYLHGVGRGHGPSWVKATAAMDYIGKLYIDDGIKTGYESSFASEVHQMEGYLDKMYNSQRGSRMLFDLGINGRDFRRMLEGCARGYGTAVDGSRENGHSDEEVEEGSAWEDTWKFITL